MNAILSGALTALALNVLYIHFISGSLVITAVLGSYLLLVGWLCIRSHELTGRARSIRSAFISLVAGMPNALALGMLSPLIVGFIVGDAVRLVSGARERHAERGARSAVRDATQLVPTPWLLDAVDAPESVHRGELLAALDPDTAWALARLHRKGVPADYVAERWQTGQPLDADALVASYREGCVS